jgi:hypothetical protein
MRLRQSLHPPGVLTSKRVVGTGLRANHSLLKHEQLLLNTVENHLSGGHDAGSKGCESRACDNEENGNAGTRGIAKDQLLDAAGRATHPALAEATLAILLKKGELQSAEGRIRLPVALDAPNPHDVLWQSLERALQAAGTNVPVISEAKSQAGLGDLDLKLAIKRGREVHALHRPQRGSLRVEWNAAYVHKSGRANRREISHCLSSPIKTSSTSDGNSLSKY